MKKPKKPIPISKQILVNLQVIAERQHQIERDIEQIQKYMGTFLKAPTLKAFPQGNRAYGYWGGIGPEDSLGQCRNPYPSAP